MSKSDQDQIATAAMNVAAAHTLRALRQVTARGVCNYRAESPDGDRLQVVFCKPGFLARHNEVRYRVYLTTFTQAADGAFESHRSEYEVRCNNPIVTRVMLDCDGTMTRRRTATIEELLDLNSYLFNWKDVSSHSR